MPIFAGAFGQDCPTRHYGTGVVDGLIVLRNNLLGYLCGIASGRESCIVAESRDARFGDVIRHPPCAIGSEIVILGIESYAEEDATIVAWAFHV